MRRYLQGEAFRFIKRQSKPVSNLEVAAHLGIDRKCSSNVMRRLVDLGYVSRRGVTWGVRYTACSKYAPVNKWGTHPNSLRNLEQGGYLKGLQAMMKARNVRSH